MVGVPVQDPGDLAGDHLEGLPLHGGQELPVAAPRHDHLEVLGDRRQIRVPAIPIVACA